MGKRVGTGHVKPLQTGADSHSAFVEVHVLACDQCIDYLLLEASQSVTGTPMDAVKRAFAQADAEQIGERLPKPGVRQHPVLTVVGGH